MGWLQRIRHAKGFGVHSPFAFRFITECLGEKLPYYAYSQLQSGLDRLIYRIAVFFQPVEIAGLGAADISAAVMACPAGVEREAAVWVGRPTAMTIADGQAEPQQVAEAIRRGDIVVVVDVQKRLQGVVEAEMGQLRYGMLFDNHRGLKIAVPLSTLPRQDIEVAF